MNVLFLVTAYPYDGSFIPGNFHKTLVESINKLGINVRVVAPVPFVPMYLSSIFNKWKDYSNIPYSYTLNGIDIVRPRYLQLPYGNNWSIPHFFSYKSILSIISKKPDIIHSHYAYPPGITALYLSKFWKIPTVLTLHGSDVNVNPHVNTISMKRFQNAVINSTRVTSVSKSLAENTFNMCGRKPEVLPLGINLKHFKELPEKEVARKFLGLSNDKKLVLFVGTLNLNKGVKELASAISNNKLLNVTGIFVGEGPLFNTLKNYNNCIFVGSQPIERIALFMKACDVFVLPSYSEGMPTVLIEAGAAKLPIIASNVGGIPELLNNERGLLINEISEKSIVTAIKHIFDNPNYAHAKSEKMKLYIEENYNSEINAKAFIDIYKQCLSQ